MKKQTVFEGVCTALITPFKGGKPDYGSFAALLERQISAGVSAVVVCGTTGENATLTDCEHKKMISCALEAAGGRIKVIAGTGSNDTAHAIKMTRFAQKAGADAVLTVTPYYNKATQEGLYKSFKAIAESTDLPVILYNVPGRTSVNMLPATCARLSEIPNIVALKEASGDLAQAADTAALCGGALDIYCGSDELALPFYSLGAKGVISVLSNLAPGYACGIWQAWERGEREDARKLFLAAMPLVRALFCEVSPSPVKYAMSRLGLCTDEVRLPLLSLSPSGRRQVDEVMEKAKIY